MVMAMLIIKSMKYLVCKGRMLKIITSSRFYGYNWPFSERPSGRVGSWVGIVAIPHCFRGETGVRNLHVDYCRNSCFPLGGSLGRLNYSKNRLRIFSSQSFEYCY